MKYLFVIASCLLFNAFSFAQNKKIIQVQQAVEQLTKALLSGDSLELHAITSAKLSYGHSGGVIENKQAFIEKFLSGKSDFITIDISDQTICISGKTAIVRHILQATNNDNGKAGTLKLKVLLVFQMENAQWKLLARQAVKA